jgi:predicted phage terminase large subunit-like protein
MVHPSIIQFANQRRVEIERELGARSLYEFFKMAWHHMDPAPFLDNWHIKLLCDELQAAAMRQRRNIAICIPPRHGKSLLVSVAFPAWVWTWWPSAKFISASYDLRMATRDASATRRLIQSSWYQERWGDRVQIRHDQGQKTYYQTTAGGHRFVTTPSAGVTGEGADFITADDPHNVKQAESEADRDAVRVFWFEAIPSRLNNPNFGVKIVIQQRVHELDLAGECIKRGYYPVVLPARAELDHPHRHSLDPRKEGELLWPTRMNNETLTQLETEMGSYASAGQLQQRPVPREGGLFKRHWFTIQDAAPSEALLNTVRRWDLAASVPEAGSEPDWTVGLKMGRDEMGRFWILDVQRFRASPMQVEQAIRALASQDGASTKIGIPEDPGQAGKMQAQYLVSRLAGYTVRAVRESGEKSKRAEPVAAQAEAGNVIILKGEWNDQFLDEICSFPMGANDDQVDALSGAFEMMTQGGGGMLDFMRSQLQNRQDHVHIPSTEVKERHIWSR